MSQITSNFIPPGKDKLTAPDAIALVFIILLIIFYVAIQIGLFFRW